MNVSPRRYSVHVVAGGAGSGKSSLLNAWFALRPPDEQWAALLNDAGSTALDTIASAEAYDSALPVEVKDISGVCACCTGQVAFTHSLAALIRQTKPRRVFIEAARVASLAELLRSLRTLGDAITVENVIVLLDLARLREAELTSPLLYDQCRHANVIIAHGSGIVTEHALRSSSLYQAAPAHHWHWGWPARDTLQSWLGTAAPPHESNSA